MRRRVHGKPQPTPEGGGRVGPARPGSPVVPTSPTVVAGDRAAAVAQRMGDVGEEEVLQGRFDVAQRSPIEDEEPLQARVDVAQRASVDEEEELQMKQREPPRNATGMPDRLKAGIESLSGVPLDDVRVHYNSAQPAQLDALAYAQGTDIHLAPGQERHLPHEAWHVVQQAQGRVRPTMQMQQGVAVNDDQSLEREADTMGARAVSSGASIQMKGSAGRVHLPIVQRVREHFVPDALEPHVHVHDGGVTFTDVGHNHKYLVRGDKRLENNIREVREDLAQRGDPRSRKINRWIARRI